MEAGSIYAFTDEAYEKCLHHIEDRDFDRIFLEISPEQEKTLILNADVLNWRDLKVLKDLEDQQLSSLVQVGILEKCDFNGFNYFLDVRRQKRVSLTFRFVRDCPEGVDI